MVVSWLLITWNAISISKFNVAQSQCGYALLFFTLEIPPVLDLLNYFFWVTISILLCGFQEIMMMNPKLLTVCCD